MCRPDPCAVVECPDEACFIEFGAAQCGRTPVPDAAVVDLSGADDDGLDWLAALRDFLADEMQQHENLVVLGDFNIAPADEDVYDPEKWGDAILCSPLERDALGKLLDLGLTDVFPFVKSRRTG